MDDVIRPFLNEDGKICGWPSKTAKKRAVLRYMSERFEPGRVYAEREVNELIDQWQTVGDLFLFRRGMVDEGFMERTRTGSEYRRVVVEDE